MKPTPPTTAIATAQFYPPDTELRMRFTQVNTDVIKVAIHNGSIPLSLVKDPGLPPRSFSEARRPRNQANLDPDQQGQLAYLGILLNYDPRYFVLLSLAWLASGGRWRNRIRSWALVVR
jgi:hypothetical protein